MFLLTPDVDLMKILISGLLGVIKKSNSRVDFTPLYTTPERDSQSEILCHEIMHHAKKKARKRSVTVL